MTLTIPKIDDRSYREILAEALARIPVHNPEWTNFNESDPGVTLLQLSAFMVENLLYRANLIPERNRLKFLQLLGIAQQAAASARGIVTFSNPRGPLETITLESDLEVLAGQVPFRTRDALDVLPLEAQVYYKKRVTDTTRRAALETIYYQLYTGDLAPSTVLEFYETTPLEPPANGVPYPVLDLSSQEVVGGAVWIALLARSADAVVATRKAIANKVLTLGILPALLDQTSGTPRTAARVLGARQPGETPPGLIYELPLTPPNGLFGNIPKAQRVARYKPITGARASDDVLAEPGVVALPLPGEDGLMTWLDLEPTEQGTRDFPPSLEDTDVQDRVVTWLRIRLPTSGGGTSQQIAARIGWVGINAARVEQKARVFAEVLGTGNGRPDQTFALINTPVIAESVRLTVNGEVWTRIDDLMAAAPEVPRAIPGMPPPITDPKRVKVFTVDRESGEIRFGTGLNGARPPQGAIIQAAYDYGGGRQGMVGIGAITKAPTLPAGLKVTNEIMTWGGGEAESVADAERRIPGYIRHRDRLVTEADFRDITARTPGADIARVEVRSRFHPDLPTVPSEGVVTVMVIPRFDPTQPDAPLPDRLFIDTVCEYLEPRRLITTELHVRGPEYVGVYVSVGFDAMPGRDIPPIREAVIGALRDFLSPLVGGFEGSGWPLDKSVDRLELLAVAARVDGVARVRAVLLGDAAAAAKEQVPISGLQLPRLLGVAAQAGEPQPLADLRGTAAPQTTLDLLPVPVIPTGC